MTARLRAAAPLTAVALAVAACSPGPSARAGGPQGPSTTERPSTTAAPTTTSAPTTTTPTTAPPTTTPPTTGAPKTRVPGTTSTTRPTAGPTWSTYTDPTFGISLRYPPTWPAPTDGRADPPYFFAVMAAAGGPMDEACRAAASHHLEPYGPHPFVRTGLSFDGQPACMVEPTGPEAPAAMAQLMVRNPTPVDLASGRYDIVVVTGRLAELPAIASTLRFTG